MNALGTNLFWLLIQVTVMALAALVVYALVRRRGPAMGSLIASCSLMLMSIVTLFAFLPSVLPRTWVPIQSLTHSMKWTTPSNHEPDETNDGSASVERRDQQRSQEFSTLRSAFDAFVGELTAAPQVGDTIANPSATGWSWRSWVAATLAFGFGIGLTRLLAGLIWVRRFRRDSRPIEDAKLQEEWEVLSAELSCVRQVELRESSKLSSAATVGWLHPLLLLPSDWRSWTDEERRAVLAHELAHIRNNDYLTWMLAQVGLLVHFYHPLAHWLSGRLRLDQELAADALAAQACGGPQPYLRSLAQLVLRQENPRLVWPAQMFLPTRRTFVRRIEMLRHAKSMVVQPSRPLRWVAVGVLVLATLFAIGLRGPDPIGGGAAVAGQAGDSGGSGNSSARNPFSLEYVPRDVAALIAVRPAEIFRNEAWRGTPSGKVLSELIETQAGVAINQLESVEVVVMSPVPPPSGEPIALVTRTTDKESADRLWTKLTPEAQRETYDGQEYVKRRGTGLAFRPDDRTVILCQDEGLLRRMIVAGKPGASSTRWSDKWQDISNQELAAVVNISMLRPLFPRLDGAQPGRPGLPPPQSGPILISAVAPLVTKADIAVASLNIGESATLKLQLHSANAADAKSVQDTLSAVVTLATNSLSAGRQMIAQRSDPGGPEMLRALDLAELLLEKLKIERDETRVQLTAIAGPQDLSRIINVVAPAAVAAHVAALRAHGMNNLKQIGLAFHNYHDTYQRFPPAVIKGPNGVTRSWRVELLPYLDAAHLYQRYRKDEPWDSENNKKVLAEMPPVFRTPQDAPHVTTTSYFVFTGTGTIFENPQGALMSEIIDGTSNTILAIESKLAVPWTKPEDIPFDNAKPMPRIGGVYPEGFNVLMGDGSVRFLSKDVDDKLLRLMILKGDGTPIKF